MIVSQAFRAWIKNTIVFGNQTKAPSSTFSLYVSLINLFTSFWLSYFLCSYSLLLYTSCRFSLCNHHLSQCVFWFSHASMSSILFESPQQNMLNTLSCCFLFNHIPYCMYIHIIIQSASTIFINPYVSNLRPQNHVGREKMLSCLGFKPEWTITHHAQFSLYF